ncbi:MAG: peptidylprolyl isomerase [Saprospiraceae bacterium]|nr:peptidylprolyl isomerase [Saprospiraceae bacterium]
MIYRKLDMKINGFLILIVSLCITSCLPVIEEEITEVTLNVEDPTYRRIVDFQDKQNLDSLLSYTSHFDPSYRFMVANALTSFQSKDGLDSLYKLLYDPVMQVRSTAAYAIGQIGESSSANELISAFKTKDTLDVNNHYNASILEAIGKVGKKNLLAPLATVSTYRVTDSLLLKGQARAIYNYALRSMTSPEGTDRMVQYLTEKEGYPEEVRVIAANYLYRARDLDLESYKFRLAKQLEEEENVDIRNVLVIALGKTKDNEVLSTLLRHYGNETDYRVKTNIVRSLSNYPYINVIEFILDKLNHENLNIATTAADFLLSNGNRNDASIYKDYITEDQHYSVKAKIYGSILKHMPVYYTNTKNRLKTSILELKDASDNPYEIAAYMTALSNDPFNYKEIAEMASSSSHVVVKSAGATALYTILSNPNFIQAFRGGQRRVKREIVELIKEHIVTGDVGACAIYGELLADEALDLKPLIEDTDFISAAMSKLELPKEIETYNSLGRALSYLSGQSFSPKTPEWNHPIDWSIFDTYGDSIQVAIKTNKGVIRVKMYPYEAPGSVANFISLALEDFYDGKTVHRVVPNFVIQGGCPRGDGYGALDYSIRSELSQKYYDDQGYIGMASAGRHTEGTQWFITHSPAMHLNGKYTIFGKVFSGMDIVHNIEVGDKIEDVIISKL